MSCDFIDVACNVLFINDLYLWSKLRLNSNLLDEFSYFFFHVWKDKAREVCHIVLF